MFVHVDILVVCQLFCIVQGLTTAAYVLTNRRPGNPWLGLLLLGLTLQVVDYFLSRSGIYYRNRWLYFTPLFFSWSFGPLLYAYGRARCGRGAPGWGHFLPGLIQLLFYLALTLQSFDTKTWFWLTVHKPYTRYVEYYGSLLSFVYYLRQTRSLLAAHPAVSSPLRRWGWLLGIFCALAAVDPLLNHWYLPAGAPLFYLTSLGLPLLVYWLALLNWRASRPVALLPAQPAPPPAPAAPPNPVAPTPVDAQLIARVVQALEQEQLYRSPDLTLDGLARHVALTPNTLSWVLNSGLGKSFYELLSEYRLAEVKRRLLTDDVRRLTVLAIALEAGFNSKTTFNRIFKEKTGMTPKEYQKKSQTTQRDDAVAAAG